MNLNKNTTYSPKDILAADGRIPVKQGRGRLSGEAVKRIQELVSEGYKVKGYSITSTAPAKSTDKVVSTEPVVSRVKASNDNIVSDFVIFWDESEYKAIDNDGKERSMRWVCNNCRVSLVQCHCGDPHILSDIAVKIVKR